MKPLRCGEDGFTLSYAKKRCEATARVNPSHASRPGRFWIRSTETCFRTRVKSLLARYVDNGVFGPPTCINWEMDAIAELNICYSQSEDDLRALPSRDVRNLIDLVRVDGYYSPIVDTGLLAVVNRTHPALAAEVLSSKPTPPTRIIICVHGGSKDNGLGVAPGVLMPSDYINIVNRKLNPGENDTLYYAGREDNLCTDRGHSFGLGAQIDEFHLVVLFTDNATRPTIGRTVYNIPLLTNGVMFELTMENSSLPRTKNLCGDGSRQVTEYCDFAGNYPACSFDCTVNPGYDCGIEKLEPSECWMEVCGDGRKTRGEECDDGNSASGDGCNNCTVENSFTCSNIYNMTSICSGPAKVIKPLNSKLKVDFRPAPLASAESDDNLRIVHSSASNGSRLSSAVMVFVVLLCASLLR